MNEHFYSVTLVEMNINDCLNILDIQTFCIRMTVVLYS